MTSRGSPRPSRKQQGEGGPGACPRTWMEGAVAALESSHSCAFPAGRRPTDLVCVPAFLSSLSFFSFRNASLKGSPLPSGTLAPGHPLRSLGHAGEHRGPATLWPVPSDPRHQVPTATTPLTFGDPCWEVCCVCRCPQYQPCHLPILGTSGTRSQGSARPFLWHTSHWPLDSRPWPGLGTIPAP